tara:strand:- start:1134 stop:2096 length:963 start_codon:yes stop_codon:yes gene_type:complete
MSRSQLNSYSKTLLSAKGEYHGRCFGDILISFESFEQKEVELQIIEGEAFILLSIENCLDLEFEIGYNHPLTSIICSGPNQEERSLVGSSEKREFGSWEMNLSIEKKQIIRSCHPQGFKILLLKKYDFVKLLDDELISHQDIIFNLNTDAKWLIDQNGKLGNLETNKLEEVFKISIRKPMSFLLFQSKILELLAMIFNELEIQRQKLQQPNLACTWNRLKPLISAKKIIEENLARPPSLGDLARQVGINEYDLKKGFKEQFGSTVFGYVGEQRMSLAFDLLKSKSQTISEVSEIVGYKNPQHFSSAFKKRYGIRPSELLK